MAKLVKKITAIIAASGITLVVGYLFILLIKEDPTSMKSEPLAGFIAVFGILIALSLVWALAIAYVKQGV